MDKKHTLSISIVFTGVSYIKLFECTCQQWLFGKMTDPLIEMYNDEMAKKKKIFFAILPIPSMKSNAKAFCVRFSIHLIYICLSLHRHANALHQFPPSSTASQLVFFPFNGNITTQPCNSAKIAVIYKLQWVFIS